MKFKTTDYSLSIRAFCKKVNVPRGTLNWWIKKFESETLATDLRCHNGRPKLHNVEFIKEFVEKELLDNCSTSIKDLVNKLFNEHGIKISSSFTNTVIKNLGYSYKKIKYKILLAKKPLKRLCL